jgi:hypothetical protein
MGRQAPVSLNGAYGYNWPIAVIRLRNQWGKLMDTLSVTIQRFIDDHFPGFVECSLVDSDGCEHQFVEKEPVVSAANLSFDSAFPQPGHIACVVHDEWMDEQGRKLVRVCTAKPWEVESVVGETNFTVLREQIVRR